MARQYDPWTNARFGFPRKDAPAFQREWKPLSSSGVLISNGSTPGTRQTLVDAPSSVGVSGTVYLWGMSFVTADSSPQGGDIEDDNQRVLTTVVATQDGPFVMHLDTPIQITENSGVKYNPLVSDANAYCTPYYVVMHKNYEAN